MELEVRVTEKPRAYVSRDKRRHQLLDLGFKLFGNRSYEDVSIDDIANEAKVSKGLMYHYFGSKRSFYVEVVRIAAEKLYAAVAPDPALGAEENLRRGLGRYFAFVKEHADAYVALMHSGLGVDHMIHPILEETRQVIVRAVLAFIPVKAPETTGLGLAVRSWLGAVEAAALHWLHYSEVKADHLIDILMAGLIAQIMAALNDKAHRADEKEQTAQDILRSVWKRDVRWGS